MFKYFLLIAFSLHAKTVCLNMIVKDESAVIERCLNSVKPFIDSWVIVDTGSTDSTQEIIRKCMSGIPGKLFERPWIDFAYNRNEALQLAKDKADYLLFLDADEQLLFAPNFQKPVLDKDFYFILSENMGMRYGRIQLINNHLNWRWEGKVHETIESLESKPKTSALLEGVVNLISWDGSRSRDPDKYRKDAALLEEEVRKDPTHKRNVFYLAKSYQDAKEPAQALKYFEKRIAMGPWDEEVQWSLYQRGVLQEELQMPPDTIIRSYCAAYHTCPSRAEPLYRLACYYNLRNQPLMSYLICKFALTLPPPNAMFVEQWIYDFALLLEFAKSTFCLGKHDETHQACVQLLSKPNLPPEVREMVSHNLKRLNL